MDDADHPTDPASGPSRQAAGPAWAVWLALARGWFVAGTLVSPIGFAAPWFRISRSYDWWYGGWHLLTTNDPDLWWIAFIFLGHALLALAGLFLPRFGPAGAAALLALGIAVACGTLIVVALAAADAVGEQGRVYFLDPHLGLFALVAGHGALIAAACAALALLLVRQTLAALPAAFPN